MASILKRGKSYFIDDLSRRETHLDGKPGRLSLSTVRRYYTMISSLMKSAYRLGHTRLKTTNRYVHAVDQAERDAANTLELILGGNRKTG